MNRSQRIASILVPVILVASLWVWQSLSDLPNGLDEMDVSQDAVRWAIHWDRVENNEQAFAHIISPGTKTPPVFFWLYTFVAGFTGGGWTALKVVPAIGYILILIGAFLLATESSGRKAGILAMLLVGCYPLVFGFGHTANTSTLAAGFEILALAFLVKSLDMVKPHFAMAAAVCIGLAIMSERGTPILIMALPVAFLFFRAIFRAATDRDNLARRLSSIAAFLAIPLVISGHYIYTYILKNWSYTMGNIANDALKVDTYWPWPEKIWAFYFVELGRRQCGGLLAIAAGLALILLIKNRPKEWLTLLIAFFGPVFIFSFIATKEVAYNFGIMPVVAVITAVGIFSIEKKLFQNLALTLLVVVAIATGLVGATGFGHNDEADKPGALLYRAAFGTYSDILYGPPIRNVPLKETAQTMIQKLPKNNFMYAAIANDKQRSMIWALMIEIAANRFDVVSVLIPRLPGSDKAIVACAPGTPQTEEFIYSLKEVCSSTDIGVCDTTSGDDSATQIEQLIGQITVEPFMEQTWAGEPVILGIYQ